MKKKKKTNGEIIANQVWDLLTDDAKKSMSKVKKTFLETIAADVDFVIEDERVKVFFMGVRNGVS